MSKIYYGAEVWAGAPQYILKEIQHIQLDAARLCLGIHTKQWSTTRLLKEMKWPSIRMIAQLSSAKITHRVLTAGSPEVLAHRLIAQMPTGRITRKTGPFKLGNRPAGVGLTKYSKYQYRANLYRYYEPIPQVLKEIKNLDKFTKRVKRWLINNDDLPTNRNPPHPHPHPPPRPTIDVSPKTTIHLPSSNQVHTIIHILQSSPYNHTHSPIKSTQSHTV